MAILNRNKKDKVLPEVDKYYEGERRDRAGLAWLLALVSVIIIALIIIGMFLLGRWIYREVTDRDDNNVAQVENGSQPAPSFDGTPESEEQDQDDSADSEEDTEENNQPEIRDDVEGRVDAPARTDVPSTPTPVTGDDPLPSTGPSGLLGIFAGVSAVVTCAHYALTNRKRTNRE